MKKNIGTGIENSLAMGITKEQGRQLAKEGVAFHFDILIYVSSEICIEPIICYFNKKPRTDYRALLSRGKRELRPVGLTRWRHRH
jgi:hypothetical protein